MLNIVSTTGTPNSILGIHTPRIQRVSWDLYKTHAWHMTVYPVEAASNLRSPPEEVFVDDSLILFGHPMNEHRFTGESVKKGHWLPI
jgi:hypothetical protein